MSRNGIREGETCADDDRPLADDARTSDQRVETAAADAAEVTCLGNTTQQDSHVETFERLLEKATVAIDWFEQAGVVKWDEEDEENKTSNPLKEELAKAGDLANKLKTPVPITLNAHRCLVHPGGMGKGRQTHLRFRISCGDVTIGLDFRTDATRRLYNFSLTIPGKACLVRGAQEVRTWVFEILAELGAHLNDEWFRRIDVCIDLPGVNPREVLFPACQEQRFISTADDHKMHFEGHEPQTHTTYSKNRLLIQIYDKLNEVLSDNDPVKRAAMRDLRWHGAIPEAATRVELRIMRNWLAQWEFDRRPKSSTSILSSKPHSAQPILDNLGAIVEKLLGDERPFFRLLESVPDRKNNHQSRVKTLPLWEAIRNKLITECGSNELKFNKISWGQMSQRHAFKVVKSYLIRCAVERRKPIRSIDDAKEELEQLSYLNDANDWTWLADWNSKANQYGLPGSSSDLVELEDSF